MLKYALLMMTLAASSATAQVLPSAGVETVRSGIGEESLSPPVMVKKAEVSSTASVVSATAGLVSSDTTVLNDPFTVKNIVVSLSGTTGFDRDAALEKGAQQAMPGVLSSMGMEPAAATKSVKSIGSAMDFVKSFKVVKETLIPTYILTADLTFNEAMLRKNFGGKLSGKPAVTVSGTFVPTSGTVVEAEPVAPIKQWIVRIVDRDPAAVEKVRTNLNGQAATKAVYRLITSAGAELVVDTPLSAMEINRVAGHEVMVSELEVALPTSTVDLPGIVSGSWQGTEAVSGTDDGAVEGTY